MASGVAPQNEPDHHLSPHPQVLRTLSENDPSNDNKCIHLLDTFSYRNHVCIVSELLGKSVFDFLKDNQ